VADHAPLHVVIDAPETSADVLHIAPMAAANRAGAERRHRLEWILLALVASAGVWRVWGLSAVVRVAAVSLAVGLAATFVDAIRVGHGGAGIAQAMLGELPRLALLGAATLFAIGAIAGTATHDADRPALDGCTGSTNTNCTTITSGGPTTTTDAERSPNHVPTTIASVPPQRSPQECPPEGNQQRRLSFAGVPPRCIDFNGHYLATVTTNFGTFDLLLNTQRAPYTVNNFAYLASWRFWDGVTLRPDPQPLVVATSMRALDPVGPDDVDQVPGYGMTFDNNTYPDLPVREDEGVWVVMTDPFHPNRWAVVLTVEGRREVEINPARWPLVGQVACGVDVIANNTPQGGYQPAYTSAPIVIRGVAVNELRPAEVPELHPSDPCTRGGSR